MPHPAAQMFELVNDVASYPDFLPWCSAANVIEQSRTEIVAALSLSGAGVTETFTTRNRLTPFERIELELVSGPFRRLEGGWTFTRLGDDAGCRVDLELEFQIGGMRSILGSMFPRAADRLVDAFCRRADALLGGRA